MSDFWREVTDFYLFTEPVNAAGQAIEIEKRISRADISELQVFGHAVSCLDLVLQRVLTRRAVYG